jgi:hypothetical protein
VKSQGPLGALSADTCLGHAGSESVGPGGGSQERSWDVLEDTASTGPVGS